MVEFICGLLCICCMTFLGFADDVLNLAWRLVSDSRTCVGPCWLFTHFFPPRHCCLLSLPFLSLPTGISWCCQQWLRFHSSWSIWSTLVQPWWWCRFSSDGCWAKRWTWVGGCRTETRVGIWSQLIITDSGALPLCIWPQVPCSTSTWPCWPFFAPMPLIFWPGLMALRRGRAWLSACRLLPTASCRLPR